MTKNNLKLLSISVFLVIVVCCTQIQQPGSNSNNTNTTTAGSVGATPTPAPCNALVDWVNNPQNAPVEIPNNGATLCDFHQFSWQWFLALMNVSGETRAFQNAQNYPLFLGKGKNSCGLTDVKTRVFIRTLKDDNENDDFVLPEDNRQAGSDAVIYDQKGNIVFYEVRFSRSECTQDPTQTQFSDPTTTEIKVAYRVITEADKPNYVWITADIDGDGRTEPNELLGMVGFHLAKSTKLHPEFVWATFEHKLNVPECQSPADPTKTWSFTSAQCASQLPNSVNQQLCSFNTAPDPSSTPALTGTPTQICRVYHAATKTGDNQYQANIFDIDSLNTQLVGPSGFITALPDTNPLAVLKNYMLVGALWESDVTQPSTNVANQRGSIQLANTTMETTFQQTDQNGNSVPYTGTGANLQNGAVNCFACHSYEQGKNVALSHIFKHIKAQQTPK